MTRLRKRYRENVEEDMNDKIQEALQEIEIKPTKMEDNS